MKKIYNVVASKKDKDGKYINTVVGSVFDGDKFPKLVLNVLGQDYWFTLFTPKAKEEPQNIVKSDDSLDDEIPFNNSRNQ